MSLTKRIVSLALAVLLCFGSAALVACHGNRQVQEEFKIDAEFDENQQIEITFWAKNENNANQVAVYQQAVEDFEALYPNIKVNLKPYSDYTLIYQDVITNISTNTTPNVCISYPDHIATYMTGQNVIVKLDELMRDSRYGFGGSYHRFDSVKSDEMIQKYLDEGKINGSYYAVPYMRSTEACYINKTYVEALGYEVPDVLTWEYIWEVSEAAMKKNADGTFAINGQKVMIPFIYKSTDNMMISMLKQKGAGYSTDDAKIEIFNDTTKEILYEIGEHAETRAFSTFKVSSYPGNYLNAGQCIFAIDSTAGATWMGSDAPLYDIHSSAIVDFETVVRPIPQYDVENPKMISQGPSICIFNKENTQEVLASWFFVQYLLTNKVQIAYAQTEGYVPVTSKAQNSEEYKDYISRAGENNSLYYDVKIAASKLLNDNVDNTFVTPVFAGSASLREAAGQMIEEVVTAKRRKIKVDDAFIETLFDNMVALYRLDQVKPVEVVTQTAPPAETTEKKKTE
ncbi:MAG: extracellular solute-binding protein [Ruminococcaceae bacterium]|nr:extracellular solute-binding protein [Oscillospiraceae bacterium]